MPPASSSVTARRLLAAAWTVVVPGVGIAQDAPPPHWRIAWDAPPKAAAPTGPAPVFVGMPPGFHVTTGPGAVLWEPRVPGDARFDVRGEVYVFPDAGDAAVGLIIGGQRLGTPQASYTAFAIRRDGAVAVLRHGAKAVDAIVPWTTNRAVAAPSTDGPALNALTVRVDSAVTFVVNGTVVAQLSRAQVGITDGAVGWRVGAGMNLHIAAFDVTRRLAAPRTGGATAPGAQTVYVVRHAERESRDRDSDLSAAGVARAHVLDSALADARLTHVVVTEFRRTANTAAPAARRHGLVPTVVANQPDVKQHAAAVAAAVRAAGPEAVVLVVGHSNTVPKIVEALGGPVRPDLCDQQYATMTIVRLEASNAPPRIARVTYGAADAADAEACTRGMAAPR